MSKLITAVIVALIASAVASFCASFPTCPDFVTPTAGLIAGGLLGLILG